MTQNGVTFVSFTALESESAPPCRGLHTDALSSQNDGSQVASDALNGTGGRLAWYFPVAGCFRVGDAGLETDLFAVGAVEFETRGRDRLVLGPLLGVAALCLAFKIDSKLHWKSSGQFCYDGIAARYQLDIARAEASFRRAFEIGSGVGPHSHAARLAGALLGQLLYETGDLAQATRLLDESYELGPEGGGVDYLAARYVIGARLRAIGGDRDSAVERLSAGMKVAE